MWRVKRIFPNEGLIMVTFADDLSGDVVHRSFRDQEEAERQIPIERDYMNSRQPQLVQQCEALRKQFIPQGQPADVEVQT